MTIILKFYCLCTKSYTNDNYGLNPNPDCQDCKGTGFYEEEFDNVERIETKEE